MKNFFGETVKCMLISFLMSFIVFCVSSVLSSGNFARSILPEAKHVLSYHVVQIVTPATAAGISTDSAIETSGSFWPPYSKDNSHCLFLIMWGLCFVYLLFVKCSEPADTCYFKTTKALYHRKNGRALDFGG